MKRVGGEAVSVPKEPKPVRSEAYRRWTTRLTCRHCSLEGHCQAAHPNSLAAGGSAGGKASDLLCFPLCSVSGNDCHRKFDQYELCPKDEMPLYEVTWCASTQRALIHWSMHTGGEAARLRALLVKLGVAR